MREDCFAWRDRRCAALIEKRCEGCNFYKPYDKHIEETNALEKKRKSKHYKEMVAEVNNFKYENSPELNALKGIHMGERLKNLRLTLGLTQKEMAHKMGYVGQSATHRLEQCAFITGKVRRGIIEKLDLDEDFFTREEKNEERY